MVSGCDPLPQGNGISTYMRLPILTVVALLIVAGPLSAQKRPNLIDATALDAARHVDTWICDTPGGDVPSALQIGMDLQARHATAVVPRGASCMSAGALAWLGGTRRRMEGRLLFHGLTPAPDADYRWHLFMLLARWSVPQYIVDRIVRLEPGEWWEPDVRDLELLSR